MPKLYGERTDGVSPCEACLHGPFWYDSRHSCHEDCPRYQEWKAKTGRSYFGDLAETLIHAPGAAEGE